MSEYLSTTWLAERGDEFREAREFARADEEHAAIEEFGFDTLTVPEVPSDAVVVQTAPDKSEEL